MAAVPVLIAIAAAFRGWVRDAFREIRAKLSRLNGYLQEHLSGMKVVQAFAQEKRVAREFAVINNEYRRANASAIAADAALYSVVEAVGAIAVAALLWHGGARIAAGGLSFGVLVQFIEYLGKFFAPLRDLSAKYTVMQQAMAAAERIFGLLDTRDLDAAAALPAPAAATAATAPATPATVQFEHVRFGYRPGLPILTGSVADHRPRRDRRRGGADRGGKIDADQAVAAVVPARRGDHPRRRARRRPLGHRRASPPHRGGGPGRVPVRGHPGRKHRPRRPRHRPRTDAGGGPARGCRSRHRLAPAGPGRSGDRNGARTSPPASAS